MHHDWHSLEPTNPKNTDAENMAYCIGNIGDTMEVRIRGGTFHRIRVVDDAYPRRTYIVAVAIFIVISVACSAGFTPFHSSKSHKEKWWMPRGTFTDTETEEYLASTLRFNSLIVKPSARGANILNKNELMEIMRLHREIEFGRYITDDGRSYQFMDLCAKSLDGSCVLSDKNEGICQCLVTSILKLWNYNMTLLENDEDIIATINEYGRKEELTSQLGNPVFDDDDDDDTENKVLSADSLTIFYFINDQSAVIHGQDSDLVVNKWEKDVFLAAVKSADRHYPALHVESATGRRFADELRGP